jgi:iron complex transport system ATP-binding protein
MKHFPRKAENPSQSLMPKRSSNSIVELSHAGVRIENTRILSGINFSVKEGERWAIVGPNGSGKTTLLKIVNGYLRPSAGKVSYQGKVSEVELEGVRKQTGFVSSSLDNLLEPDVSVLDIVVSGKYGATRLWDVPRYEDVQKARLFLRQLGCGKFEDRRLSELSQGERQKILIARSMMPDPVLLTFDEPCASLDLGARETFLKGLNAIATGNKSLAMIYVTHRIDEIPSCFNHVLLLKKGKVLASGTMDNTMTGKNLSRCFGVEIVVKLWGGRLYPVVV